MVYSTTCGSSIHSHHLQICRMQRTEYHLKTNITQIYKALHVVHFLTINTHNIQNAVTRGIQ